jgi:hypothetical protein
MRAKRLANRAREERAAYGAVTAGIVVMEGARLGEAEQYKRSPRAKAVSVSRALAAAGVPHAVIGGLALRAFVEKVDPLGVHATGQLSLLLRRGDVGQAEQALRSQGFRYRKGDAGEPLFAVAGQSRREAIHLVFAGEEVGCDRLGFAPLPTTENVVMSDDGFACLDLPSLLRLLLARFHNEDQLFIEDLLDAGLLKKDLVSKLPSRLHDRLREVKERISRERAF